MGDGNITWEPEDKAKSGVGQSKTQQPEEKLEDINASPRSSKDENNSIALKISPTNLLPLELEELHRNTNNSVHTPELSSASIESPSVSKQATPMNTPRRRNLRVGGSTGNEFGLPLGPAAGLGPQESTPSEANRAIFSVRGTRSFKINRHRDSVSVFPNGCMGIKDTVDENEDPETITDTDAAVSAPTPAIDGVQTDNETIPESLPSIGVRRPNSAARNPLTGEGYDDKDSKKQFSMRKPDGNPLLGQGYEDAKHVRVTKVPPGGFSKGLW